MHKRIAYFTGIYPSLTETFVQREIDYLRDHGIDLFVFAMRRPDDLTESSMRYERSMSTFYANPDNILLGLGLQPFYLIRHPLGYLKCILLILKQIKYHPMADVIKLFYHLVAAATFSYYLKKHNISHIHAHFSTASSMALFCHYMNKFSFSFAAHASGDIYVKPVMLIQKMEAASAIVAESEYNHRYLNLITDYQFDSKIHVVHNGVKVPDELPRSEIRNEEINLVSVGGLRYFKGFPTLIAALSILRDSGYEFNCSIIGDGPQRKLLEELILKSNLDRYITLVGSLENPEVMVRIARADIFVLASEIYIDGIRDGLPTVCTEAMSLGMPVVSTFVSGIPELIEDGISGLLVPEKYPLQLAEAIRQLIEDPDLRRRLGLNAYRRVKQLFNIETTMKDLFSILSNYHNANRN